MAIADVLHRLDPWLDRHRRPWWRPVFQVESADHLPYVFGDGGRGQILQCPAHQDVLAFALASC